MGGRPLLPPLQSLLADQALLHEHAQVIPRRVERHPAPFRELGDAQSRDALHGTQQPQPTRLSQTAIIIDPAWHTLTLRRSGRLRSG